MQFPKKNAQLTSAPLRASEGVSCWFTTLLFVFLTRSIQDHGMSDIQAVVDDLCKLIKRERDKPKEEQEQMKAEQEQMKEEQEQMEEKLEQQEVQLEKQDAELGEKKRLFVKEKEECKDNIQTITQV